MNCIWVQSSAASRLWALEDLRTLLNLNGLAVLEPQQFLTSASAQRVERSLTAPPAGGS